MRTVTTLKPGQKGIEELLTRFGPSLLCVRDRHDEVRREHLEDRGVDRPGLLSGKRSRLPSIAEVWYEVAGCGPPPRAGSRCRCLDVRAEKSPEPWDARHF